MLLMLPAAAAPTAVRVMLPRVVLVGVYSTHRDVLV
jgi:hypothetical protein